LKKKKIREFLTGIEGELELIKFTVDDSLQSIESQSVANKLLNFLENWRKVI